MDIILVKDVPNLGSLGDEVQVKSGYARNYLLPKRLAIPATFRSLAEIHHQRELLQKRRQEAIDASRTLRERLEAEAWQVEAKSGTNGRLFGAVTNRDLQQLLADRGYEMERKAVRVPAPIKTLGAHSFHVRLHTEVQVELTIHVKAESAAGDAKKVKNPNKTAAGVSTNAQDTAQDTAQNTASAEVAPAEVQSAASTENPLPDEPSNPG